MSEHANRDDWPFESAYRSHHTLQNPFALTGSPPKIRRSLTRTQSPVFRRATGQRKSHSPTAARVWLSLGVTLRITLQHQARDVANGAGRFVEDVGAANNLGLLQAQGRQHAACVVSPGRRPSSRFPLPVMCDFSIIDYGGKYVFVDRSRAVQRALSTAMASISILIALPLLAEPEKMFDELSTVFVTAEQPGPALWKVTKGDHVMWILATYGPLPKDMNWRSREIESRVATSQEVLFSGGVLVNADLDVRHGVSGVTPAHTALEASKIPGGRSLKDVLPAAVYAKWRTLREKYVGQDESIERWRPSVAMRILSRYAYNQINFTGQSVKDPGSVIDGAARENKVPVRHLPIINRTVSLENVPRLTNDASYLDLADLECFTRSLEEVEPGIERHNMLAKAWARGDINEFRELYREALPGSAYDCTQVLMTAFVQRSSIDAVRIKKLYADFQQQTELGRVKSERTWIAAARRAIDKNRSTFAVVSMAQAVSRDGVIEKLLRLGYTVEGPQ